MWYNHQPPTAPAYLPNILSTPKMDTFSHLIRFESEDSGDVYFADLGPDANGPPARGTKLTASKTIEGLAIKSAQSVVTIRRVSSFVPSWNLLCRSVR
jgi:hypothetical protein